MSYAFTPARLLRPAAILFFACLLILAGMAITANTSSADETLESAKGGLFHRKGWVSPEIYAKKAKPAASKRAKTRSRRKTQTKSTRTKTRTANRSAKLRRQARAKQRRARNRRRIPSRIVKQRERKVSKTAKKSTKRTTRVASLGRAAVALPAKKSKASKRSVTGGSARVQWAANSRCIPARLRSAIYHVARNYGRVRVTSTCRSRRHNRRVGGASNSWHLKGRAADFRVFGNIGKTARYLRGLGGGYKHYGGGLFHIDTGPRRSW